jgi:serine/threonine protein kinase
MGERGATNLMSTIPMETGETELVLDSPGNTITINPTDTAYYDKATPGKCGYRLIKNPASKYVAKGSYGMVYRPAYLVGQLNNCLFDSRDHPLLIQPETKYVTKVGITDYMLEEYQEYDSLKEIDPTYKFHYPKPIFVDNLELDIPVPTKCTQYFRGKYGNDYLLENEPYSFLVMNDGGHSLAKCIEEPGYFSMLSTCVEVLVSFAQVFHGIKALVDNQYMHYDLKVQNIVYDKQTGLTKMIDFGLTRNAAEIQRGISNAKNGRTWFNYPIEKFMITQHTWEDIKAVLSGEDDDYPTVSSFVDFVFHHDPDPYDDAYWYEIFVPHEHFPWHKAMLDQIDSLDNITDDYNVTSYLKYDFEKFLNIIKDVLDTGDDTHIQAFYQGFLEEYCKKVDIFGAGLSLLCLLSPMKETMTTNGHYILWSDFVDFTMNLLNCNVFDRYDIETAIHKYEVLLNDLRAETTRTSGGRAVILQQQPQRQEAYKAAARPKLIRDKPSILTTISRSIMNTISPAAATTTTRMSSKDLIQHIMSTPDTKSKEYRRKKQLTVLKVLELDPPEKVMKNQEFDAKFMAKLATKKANPKGGKKGKKTKKAKKASRKTKKSGR